MLVHCANGLFLELLILQYVWPYEKQIDKRLDEDDTPIHRDHDSIKYFFTQRKETILSIAGILTMLFGLYLTSSTFAKISYASLKTQPNIVFILTDDQGMGDMVMHALVWCSCGAIYDFIFVEQDISGSDFEGLMPTIRAMCTAGVNLTNYYSIPLCTPARSALLTGKYPVNNGMQHGVITGAKMWGLPSTEVLLPEYLSELGYSSHIVGKWHLVSMHA
jgi:hypothetical protein